MTSQPTWTRPRLRVLRLLFSADAPVWALDVARSTGISYGTVYDTFRRLYDLGWSVGITTPVPSRPARVLYRLTTEGRQQAVGLLGESEGDA